METIDHTRRCIISSEENSTTYDPTIRFANPFSILNKKNLDPNNIDYGCLDDLKCYIASYGLDPEEELKKISEYSWKKSPFK